MQIDHTAALQSSCADIVVPLSGLPRDAKQNLLGQNVKSFTTSVVKALRSTFLLLGRVWFLGLHLHRIHHAIFSTFGRLHVSLGQARPMQNRAPSQAERKRRDRPFPRARPAPAPARAKSRARSPLPVLSARISPRSPPLSPLMRRVWISPSLLRLPFAAASPHRCQGKALLLSSPSLLSQALVPPSRPQLLATCSPSLAAARPAVRASTGLRRHVDHVRARTGRALATARLICL